jgi:hypothetical protein
MPFYGEKTDLSFMFESNSTSIDEASREGEKNDTHVEQPSRRMEAVIGDSTPLPCNLDVVTPGSSPSHENDCVAEEPQNRNTLRVYTRRKFRSQAEAPQETPNEAPIPDAYGRTS